MPARRRMLKLVLLLSPSQPSVCLHCRHELSSRIIAQAYSKANGWRTQLRAASTIPSVTAIKAQRYATHTNDGRSRTQVSLKVNGKRIRAASTICSVTAVNATNNGWSRTQVSPKATGWQTQPHRVASTIPSVTAVNAKKEVPIAFQELHASLKALEQRAGLYVDTSQLKLAMKSLETENAIIRVAVLGLNGQAGARRLTRALLADPLIQEEPWEKQLLGGDEGSDGRAVLLRYGRDVSVDERHPLVRSFSIPSSTLLNHNLEILVYDTPPSIAPSKEGAASLLVPQLDIVNSTSGRLSMVTYPVHKTLLYQEGLKSLGGFVAIETHGRYHQHGHAFKGVIDWSWSIAQQQMKDEQSVSPINLALAEAGIETLRKSLGKSLEYENLWFDAGIPVLSAWLTKGTEGQSGSIKPAVRGLIEIICENANQRIRREAVVKLQQEENAAVPVATRDIISKDISSWAEKAHMELRDRLNSAFHSRNWRKTKWWKLFWRVDDVGHSALDILRRAWLVDAEKEMIWLAGRIYQSGLLGTPNVTSTPSIEREDEPQRTGNTLPAPNAAQSSDFKEPAPVLHPWPQDISRARSTLANLTVPPFQALAQALLLQTLSTNVLASSLAALIYISISTTSPYESSAVAATGLVWSLRRLQKRWEIARTEWEAEVREKGRIVLRSVEGLARQAVEGYQPKVDEAAIEERAVAVQAVGNVGKALEAIKS